MSEVCIADPSVVVITGTHSSGKSTLLAGIESGKLDDLGITSPEYSDFGYTVLKTGSGDVHPIVTVPETARWLAELVGHPEHLSGSYTLDFQLDVDSQAWARIIEATWLAGELAAVLISHGELPDEQSSVKPLVIADRGPLDGIVYSTLRIPNQDTNLIPQTSSQTIYPRTGFLSEWTKSFVSMVVITDSRDAQLKLDATRLDNEAFREQVALQLRHSYMQTMGEHPLHYVSGSREACLQEFASLLRNLVNAEPVMPAQPVPYDRWLSIKLEGANDAPETRDE